MGSTMISLRESTCSSLCSTERETLGEWFTLSRLRPGMLLKFQTFLSLLASFLLSFSSSYYCIYTARGSSEIY